MGVVKVIQKNVGQGLFSFIKYFEIWLCCLQTIMFLLGPSQPCEIYLHIIHIVQYLIVLVLIFHLTYPRINVLHVQLVQSPSFQLFTLVRWQHLWLSMYKFSFLSCWSELIFCVGLCFTFLIPISSRARMSSFKITKI